MPASGCKPLPSLHDVRFWWTYDPTTGFSRWRNSPNRKIREGSIAGDFNQGNWRTRLDGEIYPIARLIWLYMTGDEPQGYIAFVNQNPRDLRWTNLIDAPARHNYTKDKAHDRMV